MSRVKWNSLINSSKHRSTSSAAFTGGSIFRPIQTASRKWLGTWDSSGPGREPQGPPRYYCGGRGNSARDDELKRNLIHYNMSDCRAAATVSCALERICGGGASDFGAVDVSSLEVSFQHAFGKLDCALPEFKKINDAAYWDYQRSKVYARTDKTVRRSARKPKGKSKVAGVEKELVVDDVPAQCPRCRGTRFWIHGRGSQVTLDLKFSRRGIKRWAVRYLYKTHRCSECRLEVNIYSRGPRFGSNLVAFVVYLLIELRLSHQKSAEHLSSVFELALTKTDVTRIKSRVAQRYIPTYRGLRSDCKRNADPL